MWHSQASSDQQTAVCGGCGLWAPRGQCPPTPECTQLSGMHSLHTTMRVGTNRAEGPGRKLATAHFLLDARKMRTRNTDTVLEACVCPKERGFVREEGRNSV